jgi:hypothetical protein
MKRRVIFAALTSFLVALFSLAIAVPAQAVVVGVSTIKANDPHPSGHVAGTINAVWTVSCSMVMDEIYIQTYLEKSTGGVWVGAASDYFNTSYESSNAVASRSNGPGVFRTRVSYAIDAPPGINPAYHANTIYSPWKSVACGAASRLASADQGFTETVAITQE